VIQLSDHAPGLPNPVTSADLELEIAWSNLHSRGYVRLLRVGINGQPFATIRCDAERQWSCWLVELHPNHPVFTTDKTPSFLEDLLPDDSYPLELKQKPPHELAREYPLLNCHDGLPSFEQGLQFFTGPVNTVVTDGGVEHLILSPESEAFVAVVSRLVVGPAKLVSRWLDNLVYLGPLREPPPRDYTPTQNRERNRWASGLAAWDELHETDLDTWGRSGQELTDEVCDWLTAKDKLSLGYRVFVRYYRELSESSFLVGAILSGSLYDNYDAENVAAELESLPRRRRLVITDDSGFEMSPCDVGVGISQVIPVVTLALCRPELAALEQPELHLHPGAQVGLGDLFIECVQNGKIDGQPTSQRLLVETHSEHLLLRLLRRIRETTDDELPAGHPGLRPDELSVIYVEPQAGGLAKDAHEGVRISQLRIDESGEFRDRWPRGFFEERAGELFGP
jgi:hypothetical protein